MKAKVSAQSFKTKFQDVKKFKEGLNKSKLEINWLKRRF